MICAEYLGAIRSIVDDGSLGRLGGPEGFLCAPVISDTSQPKNHRLEEQYLVRERRL